MQQPTPPLTAMPKAQEEFSRTKQSCPLSRKYGEPGMIATKKVIREDVFDAARLTRKQLNISRLLTTVSSVRFNHRHSKQAVEEYVDRPAEQECNVVNSVVCQKNVGQICSMTNLSVELEGACSIFNLFRWDFCLKSVG